MRLLVTGGGTGGHVYPLLAVLQNLAAGEIGRGTTHEVLYVGRAGSIEERLARRNGIRFSSIRVAPLRSLAPWTSLPNLMKMMAAIGQSERIIDEFKPEVLLATGGFVSAPSIWAAAMGRTPVVIYLPDIEPGWAIRALSRWAWRVAVSFSEVVGQFPAGKAEVTGYPVRRGLYQATRAQGREYFHLDLAEPVVTIFGGSQGARSINQAVLYNLSGLLALTQVIHIAGRADLASLQKRRDELTERERARYLLFDYLDEDMPLALASANLVIARSGAATLGEFPAMGLPSILVPYPHAGKHQEKNAEFMVARGAAVMLLDANLRDEFLPAVSRLILDRQGLEQMEAAARRLARPDASGNILKLLMQGAANSRRMK